MCGYERLFCRHNLIGKTEDGWIAAVVCCQIIDGIAGEVLYGIRNCASETVYALPWIANNTEVLFALA